MHLKVYYKKTKKYKAEKKFFDSAEISLAKFF